MLFYVTEHKTNRLFQTEISGFYTETASEIVLLSYLSKIYVMDFRSISHHEKPLNLSCMQVRI